MKKCRSRIIFNRENETTMKNEIFHNHVEDPTLYDNFLATAVDTRCFGKNKNINLKHSRIFENAHDDDDDDDDTDK